MEPRAIVELLAVPEWSKGGDIGSFGGGKLERPRRWLGAQPGRPLSGSAELGHCLDCILTMLLFETRRQRAHPRQRTLTNGYACSCSCSCLMSHVHVRSPHALVGKLQADMINIPPLRVKAAHRAMGQAADAVEAGRPGALQPSSTVAWIVVFGLRAIALCGLRKCMLLAAAGDEGRALVACWELQTMLRRRWPCRSCI